MPLMHLWQEHFGFISDEGVNWIAAKLGLEPINILELVTFYPMFRQAPAGRKHIRVCRTLSCAMAGAYPLMEKLAALTNIDRAHHDRRDAQLRLRSAPTANTASNSSNASPVAAPRRSAWWTTNSSNESSRKDRARSPVHDSRFTIESPAVASQPLRTLLCPILSSAV